MSSQTSSSWYRVASLKPRLRSHIQVHRHPVGNDVAFLLQDHSLGKFYRFNVHAYDILGRLDGLSTVHDIWEASVVCLGDDAPTQDDIIALLGRLHSVDALQLNVTPDCLELFERSQRSKKTWWKTVLRSPLSVRIPLLDPERALSAIMPIVGPVFSRGGFVVWLLVVIWAVLIAALHWPELSHGGIDQILDPSNLLLLLLVYPVVKTFHEFGHAITTRKWGGEVHEMGITLLVFVPIPYVDASAMSAVGSKYRRMLISASGMMVELFLAAIALLIWINVEPGLLRLTAFNVMLISGVSTLIFNGNPLLRFDAYYILKDAIGIPNLASRSSRYLAYLAQHYLFGLVTAESPVTRNGERSWLLCYGIAAMIFRVLMTFTIVLFIAGHYFVVGVVMALWALVLLVGVPVVKLGHFLLFNQGLADKRPRALTVSVTVFAVLCAFVFLAPVPSATQAQGVLWLPDQAQVQAGTSGVVTEVLAEPSTHVKVGQALLAMADPLLRARISVLEAELDELQVRHRIKNLTDRVKATLIKDQITSKQGELDRELERAEQLVVHSNKSGIFVLRRPSDLPGRYVRQGERLGFVLEKSSMTVRVAVPQHRIGLIRETLRGVEVKLAESIKTSIPATLTRGVPAAQRRLPSKVLGRQGGGIIAVDPSDEKGLTTLQSVFVLDVTLREEPSAWRIGQRAYVKFDHGNQPLAEQWYRRGRQLFIRRFGV
jgi:putative peptide zinc metalloprotease protein